MVRLGFEQYPTGTESNQCATSCLEQHHFSLSSKIIRGGSFLESSGEVNIKQRLETQRHHLNMQSRVCGDLNCKETLHTSLVRAADMVIILEKKQPLEKFWDVMKRTLVSLRFFYLLLKKVNFQGMLWVIDWLQWLAKIELPSTTDSIFMFLYLCPYLLQCL